MAGLSQEALAEAAGIHFTTVSLLEHGKRAPTIVTVEKLAVALGTTMAALITELEKEKEAGTGAGKKKPKA